MSSIRIGVPAQVSRTLFVWHYDINAVVAACLCAFLVGVLLAVPFKVKDEAPRLQLRMTADGAATLSRQEIAGQYTELESRYKELQKELAQERTLKQGLEAKLADQERGSTDILQDLQRARLFGGTVPAEGPGIVLKLTEDLNAADPDDVGLRMIHQEDLLNIVNELWSAGAEALAIRSPAGTERIVSSTAIRCVGPVVIVNSQRMAPPFEILAIGNGPTLKQALEIPNGVLAVLGLYRIKYEIRESKKLVLPAYSGKTFLEYTSIHQETLKDAGSAAAGSNTKRKEE
ncbi:MAG: hypothetical protein GEEBNDBF_02237 [bacterium]|nr:hypothetical protein [bacterium]